MTIKAIIPVSGTESARPLGKPTGAAAVVQQTLGVDWSATSSHVISARSGSTLSTGDESPTSALSISPGPEQVYPHLFDEDTSAGQTRVLVELALNDARLALDSFGQNDFDSIGSRLGLIAASMQKAHRLTTFNESFGSVISYIRRAVLAANSADVTRPGLNALIQALQSLHANPAMDLDDASELVEALSVEGWQGDHDVVNALIAILFSEDVESNLPNDQAELFSENNRT
ncbi:hypothetical protein HDG34_005667 [Paraburkholderia sp. HC6.4b]|uniref:hypothetical protein n=1 Tax=unclassified Paraburkholderia TaxID=2615204 RepID=UPI001607ABB3|nr:MULTISPECIES: hypothetical protein [unclassified Paraburkholderia]MBB5411706.1 hypothetical protein [Paraburkholderia sp. HC6.4b]MBB5453265.1 hypothetical protein [Paraburkholderia sp. Kb1A]